MSWKEGKGDRKGSGGGGGAMLICEIIQPRGPTQVLQGLSFGEQIKPSQGSFVPLSPHSNEGSYFDGDGTQLSNPPSCIT